MEFQSSRKQDHRTPASAPVKRGACARLTQTVMKLQKPSGSSLRLPGSDKVGRRFLACFSLAFCRWVSSTIKQGIIIDPPHQAVEKNQTKFTCAIFGMRNSI